MRVMLILLLACVIAPSARAQSAWPTKEWKRSTPEAQGVDPIALNKLDEEFSRGDHGYVDGMLVIRNGKSSKLTMRAYRAASWSLRIS